MNWKTSWVQECVEMVMIVRDIEIATLMVCVKEYMGVTNLSVNGSSLILV